ncbi:integrator complex subunit 10 isoform X2 [Frankliniella occidentalis]|uniref:Integrator complex subunit 10 n=1 Tax=Frankliniella occidentalis TaxID=133901 RepID=A0A6J1RSJ4_FRAOC|nr:integrator complex subunit 10 isoform X2 [Frankliniella occidentalis]
MPVTMAPSSTEAHMLSDEDYLVLRAKQAFTIDPHAAKAWMLTAKTLYPNNFAVQFEAYNIVKSAKNVKEAAKCFETLLQQFQGDNKLWHEVELLTRALRSDNAESEPSFLRAMFANLSTDAQQQLLQVTADRSKDTMEHCRLLMILLSRFPHAVAKHGPRLVDTLLSAEKHSHCPSANNCYRKLLVCELVPLMGSSPIPVELPLRQIYRLMHKLVEYYMLCLLTQDSSEADPWEKIFQGFWSLGLMLNWDLAKMFSQPWGRELYWQQILNNNEHLHHSLDPESHEVRQHVYCTGIFFMRCLHEYTSSLQSGEHQLVLLEAFVMPIPERETSEPPPKRRKGDDSLPLVTVDTPTSSNSGSSPTNPSSGVINCNQSTSSHRDRAVFTSSVVANLTTALRCWSMINSKDAIQRGVTKLLQMVGVDMWLSAFHQDVQLYRGEVNELVTHLLQVENPGGTVLSQTQNTMSVNASVVQNLRLSSGFFYLRQLPAAVDRALQIIGMLGSIPVGGTLSSNLLKQTHSQRHIHLLPLTRTSVLQYCVHLILSALQHFVSQPPGGGATTTELDMCVGNMLVLLQLELGDTNQPMPGAIDLLTKLVSHIRSRSSFSYPIFTNYIVNTDILEEIMHLATKQEGSVAFEIAPPSSTQLTSQRRISTRGVDKGAKEDFKSAMRRQVARSDEPVESLLIKFLTSEQDYVRRLLWPQTKAYAPRM